MNSPLVARIITYEKTKRNPETRRYLSEAFVRPGERMARQLTELAPISREELITKARELGYTVVKGR